MKSSSKVISILLVSFLLSACNDETISVADFLANRELMHKTLKDCRAKSDSFSMQNCANAVEAEFRAGLKSGGMAKLR